MDHIMLKKTDSSPVLGVVEGLADPFSMEEVSPKETIEVALWGKIHETLKREFGRSTYGTWFQAMEQDGIKEGRLGLLFSTPFIADWVSTHYAPKLQFIIKGHLPQVTGLAFLSSASTPSQVVPRFSVIEGGTSDSVVDPSPSVPISPSSSLSASLDSRFTFENFVVGKPNELAYAAAMRVAEDKKVSFNPLFLYGAVGLGKTHLMHAIAWRIRELHPERRVIYLSAEKFMYQFIRALRDKNTMAFKEQFRSVDVLMIDDVQFICGKESTQEEVFHTFNALMDQNRQIIVSADKSPSDLDGLEERMRSRLGWGLVADIHPTTYELRLGILQAKTEALGLDIPLRVLEFIAHKIASNIRELEGALTRISAHSSFGGREITLDMAQEVLRDLLRANDRRLRLDDVQKKVCERFGVKVSEIQSPARYRSVARPRQIAMYLSKMLTTKSYPEIGRFFGGRDHTTVVHAVKAVEALMEKDDAFCQEIEFIKRTMEP